MIGREYETVYVMKPDLPDDRGPKVVEKITKAIERQSGVLLGFDDWGKKKLAYEIQKSNRGVIVQVGYCGGGQLVNEVERELRLDDAVVRHFTLKLADEVDADLRQKEYATTKRVRREAPEEDERDDREFRSGYGDRDRESGYGGGGRDFDDDRATRGGPVVGDDDDDEG